MIELMEQLLELANQAHYNCRLEMGGYSREESDDYCAERLRVISTSLDSNLKEHLILDRARKMLAEMKKY